MSFVQKGGESRGGFLSLNWKRLIDYILLLFLWIVNGHDIMNVLKAAHPLKAFASKYMDCLSYGSFCEGICMCVVLDVHRPWKRPGKKGMLRLGMGWALASYHCLCLGFWKTLSKNPRPGLIPSSLHCRISPDKAEDMSFRQPRLWPCSLSPDLKLCRWREVCHFRAHPQVLANTSPWEMPHTTNICTQMQSLVPPTLSEGGYS